MPVYPAIYHNSISCQHLSLLLGISGLEDAIRKIALDTIFRNR